MAALLIRSLFHTKENNIRGRYNIIRPNVAEDDKERGSSVDSGIAMSENPATDAKRQLPARINPRLISDATIGLSDGLVCI